MTEMVETGECLVRCRLPRQVRLPHQERVDRARAQAALADRPHHQRLAAAHVAGGEHVRPRGLVVGDVGADVAALVEIDARASSAGPRARDAQSPWPAARARRRARTRCRAIGLNLSSTCTQCSFCTLPSMPENFCRQHREVALGAFGLARGRAHLQRPVRPGQALVLMLGRRRHDFELGHGFRALPERGADAVGAGVAAADHDDMLAARRGCRRLPSSGSPETRRFCCGRKSIAKWMPASSRPGIGRSRAASAPPVSATASYWLSSSRGSTAPAVAAADMGAVMEGDALGFHLRHAAVDDAASPS